MTRRPLTALAASTLALCFVVLGSAARADTTVALSLVANGDGIWAEGFSDAFGQVDGGPNPAWTGGPGGFDGAYVYADYLLEPPVYTPVPGSGGITAFTFGSDWGEVGTITVDDSGLTGSGVEVAPITDVAIDFATFIADNDAITGGPYTTNFTAISGTVTFENGVATAIDLTTSVTLTYDFSGFSPGTFFDFFGSFNISGGDFALLVDTPTYTTPLGDVSYVWDVGGAATVSGELMPAVPTLGGPAVAALATLLAATSFAMLRARHRD